MRSFGAKRRIYRIKQYRFSSDSSFSKKCWTQNDRITLNFWGDTKN